MIYVLYLLHVKCPNNSAILNLIKRPTARGVYLHTMEQQHFDAHKKLFSIKLQMVGYSMLAEFFFIDQ